jgi:4,5-dihydroxyphthalate decarboxylase
MLVEGQIDALVVPRVPEPALGGGQVTRLFRETRAEERYVYAETAVFPIMHTLVVKEEVLGARPGLSDELLRAFEASKRAGYELYADPNWSHLADARLLFEEDRAWLGPDPYPYGLQPNRVALERLLSYMQMLGLIDRRLEPDDLFQPAAKA